MLFCLWLRAAAYDDTYQSPLDILFERLEMREPDSIACKQYRIFKQAAGVVCGSPYKRVTWNIHGRKEIVWRCVNRVTYGTKFCHNSPSVQEEALHQTLLRAIQNLADNYTEEVAMQINGILHDLQGGTTELEELQKKLADARQEFDRLLDLSLECDASFLDEKLKHTSEEIDSLQKQIDQLTASQQKAANPNLQLTASDFHITEYSDAIVARIIERIDIVSANEIKIEFIGGYTVAVPLQE